MATYREAKCRLCRREGAKLFLKGDKCYNGKCPFEKRPIAPGAHGLAAARKKVSAGTFHVNFYRAQAVFFGCLNRCFGCHLRCKGGAFTRAFEIKRFPNTASSCAKSRKLSVFTACRKVSSTHITKKQTE